MKEVSIHLVGDRSILLRFGNEIRLDLHQRVRNFLATLDENADFKREFLQIQPAYASVLLTFNPLLHHPHSLLEKLKDLAKKTASHPPTPPRSLEIPVWYGGDAGPDLNDVARLAGLKPEEVIGLHSGATYRVYFMGFMPGFAYLGGLPQEISTPRLATARKKVPKGSIGIGGLQTGIYPLATPGGWRLIGRTYLDVFNPGREPLSLLEMGDEIRFKPISKEEFQRKVSP